MMALSSFCGLLTLQVGSAMLAVVLFVMAVVVFAINVLDMYTGSSLWPLPLVLVIIFTVLLVVCGIIMFLAAYNESRSLCMVSVVVLAITMLYWLILSCLSLSNQAMFLTSVCLRDRCGESFWLMDLRYRGNWHKDRSYTGGSGGRGGSGGDNTTYNWTSTSVEPSTSSIGNRRRRFRIFAEKEYNNRHYNTIYQPDFQVTNDNNVSSSELASDEFSGDSQNHYVTSLQATFKRFERGFEDNSYEDLIVEQQNSTEKTGSHKDDSGHHNSSPSYTFGLPMVGGIILFIVNFVFFLFTILIMWSYAQELKWSGLYDDTPSVSTYS